MKLFDFGEESCLEQEISFAKIKIDTREEFIDFIGTEKVAPIFGFQLSQFIDKERVGELNFKKISVYLKSKSVKSSKYLLGWYGRQQFSSLNLRTSFLKSGLMMQWK